MITARAFAGKHYAVYGLARSGLATVEALLASGAKVTAWDANEEAREQAPDGAEIADLDTADLSQFDSLVVTPGPAAQPPPDRDTGPRGRRRDHRRHRAVRPRPARASAAQGGRDHRHQRQVDHHRARPPHPQDRGRAERDGRQYRPADPRPGPVARRRGLCARAVELPARPDAKPRLRRRRAAQHHARPPRPLRQLRGLRGVKGAAIRDAVGGVSRSCRWRVGASDNGHLREAGMAE